jgi:hypothetical protein
MGKIVHLSAGEGKMELWSKDEMVFSSGKASELAKAFLKHGCEETMRTSSSFDFGRESGFRTNDAVHKLFDRTFKIINKS